MFMQPKNRAESSRQRSWAKATFTRTPAPWWSRWRKQTVTARTFDLERVHRYLNTANKIDKLESAWVNLATTVKKQDGKLLTRKRTRSYPPQLFRQFSSLGNGLLDVSKTAKPEFLPQTIQKSPIRHAIFCGLRKKLKHNQCIWDVFSIEY